MIRMLAWWGTTSARSSAVIPARVIAFSAALAIASTARRNTSLPCMTIFPPWSQ